MKRRLDGQPRAVEGAPKTVVFDVNDDCLREVFRHLDLFDLCTVADVCLRFRANAQEYFRKHKNLDINSIYCKNRMPGVFKMLRHTGAYAKSVQLKSPISRFQRNKTNEFAIIELISRYCTDDAARLILKYIDAADDFAASMPQLVILQIERMDSTRAQNVNELDEMIQKIPQSINYDEMEDLEVISLGAEHDMDHQFFEKILEKNRQLKKIEIVYCAGLDHRVLPLIAARTPQIESLRFNPYANVIQSGFNWGVMCLSQLSKLNALTISCDHLSFSSVIDAMAAANIPLERLNIEKSNLDQVDVFVAGISKFKNLKSLKLSEIRSLNLSHITTMVESLVELTELQLNKSIALNEGNILALVQSMKNLQHFYYHITSRQKMCIDDNMHAELVKIAKERRKKILLKISGIEAIYRVGSSHTFSVFPNYEVGLTLSIN